MQLQELIKKIIPFYNFHRKNQANLTGTEALENIWEVGDLLKNYLEVHTEVAPRTLYHQIYGKSEKTADIAQKSYITRDFLDRAYRVRRIFSTKKSIREVFPTLQRYRLFYKSMPFLDEGRYKMNEADRKKLVQLLNSAKTYNQIITELEGLRKKRIGLRIPRDSKLGELEGEKLVFIKIYNQVFHWLKESKLSELRSTYPFLKNVEFIKLLSQNTGALSSDSLKMLPFNLPELIEGDWLIFAEMISRFELQKDAKVRRRFRRLIPPEKMVRLSEMLYTLSDERSFNSLKAR